MGALRTRIERSVAAENERDLDAMLAGYAPGAVYVDPSGTEVRGREAIAELYRGFFTTFPDGHRRLDRVVEEGDWVAFEGSMTGTNTGPFPASMGGMPATGRRVDFRFVGMARIEDGQATHLRMYFDQLTVLGQLGLIPPPGGQQA